MKSIYIYLFVPLFISCQRKCFIAKIIDSQKPVRRITYAPDRIMSYQEDPLILLKVINGADTIYGLNFQHSANFKAFGIPAGEETTFNFHFLNGQTWDSNGILQSQKIAFTKSYKLTSQLIINSEMLKTLRMLPLAYLEIGRFKIYFDSPVAKRIKQQANCLATYW